MRAEGLSAVSAVGGGPRKACEQGSAGIRDPQERRKKDPARSSLSGNQLFCLATSRLLLPLPNSGMARDGCQMHKETAAAPLHPNSNMVLAVFEGRCITPHLHLSPSCDGLPGRWGPVFSLTVRSRRRNFLRATVFERISVSQDEEGLASPLPTLLPPRSQLCH